MAYKVLRSLKVHIIFIQFKFRIKVKLLMEYCKNWKKESFKMNDYG
jgi:hypothetical protein